MSKPDYDGLIKLAPISLLLTHDETGGRLYMGMRPKTYVGFDLVVNCEYHDTRLPLRGFEGQLLRVPLWDDDEFDLEPHRQTIEAAARQAKSGFVHGGQVLIHCTGGLNRSGVVAVLAVAEILGVEAKEAVEIVREARDPFVLCNRAFERWVTGEQLPNAETSAFLLDDADVETEL